MSFWKSLSLKRKLIILAACMVFFFFLFRFDYVQQKSYAVMYDAYELFDFSAFSLSA